MRRGGAGALREQLLVHRLAPVVDAGRARLLAVGQRQKQVGELGIAVLIHESGCGIAPAPAGRLADDRQRRGAKVR
jgi:hypothetical protein